MTTKSSALNLFHLPFMVVMALACEQDRTLPTSVPTQPAYDATEDTSPKPRVWVHYDYLVYPDGRSDAPDPTAIQMVVDVYAAHGITLAIDSHHSAVPTSHHVLSILPDICDDLYVGDVKAQYFHPTSNHEWHYALFGDRAQSFALGSICGTSISGSAEINGDNLVIGMDFATRFGLQGVAAAFMHELGHNLGLHHGGNEDANNKPNYLSVMNYLDPLGIPFANALGSTSFAGYRLDYSGSALPRLDPAHLNKTVGIQAGTTDIALFRVDRSDLCDGCIGFGEGPGSGPIDWNLDGNLTETDVAVHLLIPCTDGICPQFGAPLTGFDDWAEVRGYVMGTITHGPKTIAPEDAAEQPTVNSISPATGLAAGGTVVTISGAHLSKATQVIFGSAGPASSFTIADPKTIIAISPPSPYPPNLRPAGFTTDVTVVSGVNPSPSVSSDVFTYPAWEAPVIQSVSPSAGPLSGGTAVTISGRHLAGATAVNFGPVPAATFTVLNDSTIGTVSPDPGGYPYGNLSVMTLGGTGDGVFRYVPQPILQSISPAIGFEAGGTSVTISVGYAEYRNGIKGVSFGSAAASFTPPTFTNQNGYTLTAVSPPGVGTVDVTVANAGGTSAVVTSDRFSYVPTVRISSLSPDSGSPGTVVTIKGQNLGIATDVIFGWASASSFTVLDDSTIVATAPLLPVTGVLRVWVSTPAGTTNSASFTLQ